MKDYINWLMIDKSSSSNVTKYNVFKICCIIQQIVLITITVNDIISHKDVVLDGVTILREAIDSFPFAALSIIIMTIVIIGILDSFIILIGKGISKKVISKMAYSTILCCALISPFIGYYAKANGNGSSQVDLLCFLYFFYIQQSMFATFLGIEIGAIYSNKLVNYYSISILLLSFNIGTYFCIVLFHTIDDDFINCSFFFCYSAIGIYTIMVAVISVHNYYNGMKFKDIKFLTISLTAIVYQFSISAIMESSIGDENSTLGLGISHVYAFGFLIVCLAYIGIVIPNRILRMKHECYNKKLRSVILDEAVREKELMNNILAKIFPSSIVSQMQSGSVITPQSFEKATIFFSDIEGFTQIASTLDPKIVMKFLNRLFSLFDYIADKLPGQLYKIETVGDAYILASGLPEIDKNHAVNVANFSLLLKELAGLVNVPIQDTPVRVRIGLHTGNVAAGIVGTKMPRYCLYGDTINYASRMESTGVVGKIQISEETFECLSVTNEFIIEERGEVEVKGKGSVKTYFLIDYSPHNKILNKKFMEEFRIEAMAMLDNLNDISFDINKLVTMRGSILPNSISYSDLKNLLNGNVKEVKRTQVVPILEQKEEPFYFV